MVAVSSSMYYWSFALMMSLLPHCGKEERGARLLVFVVVVHVGGRRTVFRLIGVTDLHLPARACDLVASDLNALQKLDALRDVVVNHVAELTVDGAQVVLDVFEVRPHLGEGAVELLGARFAKGHDGARTERDDTDCADRDHRFQR